MSDFAEFDAIRFRFDAIKNIGLLSRQEAKINFNGKPVNEEISKIVILDYYGKDIRFYLSKEKSNVITKCGIRVCDIPEEILDCIPTVSRLNKIDNLIIDIPGDIELIMGRGAIASSEFEKLFSYLK